MRTHVSRPGRARRRDGAPAHHRRQPHDQLLDRACEPTRSSRVAESEQVALDRVGPRLQPIVTRRDTPASTPSPQKQRADDQATRLGRKRLARRPIPATTRNSATRKRGVLQRHRQRPSARVARQGQRRRADARGAADRTDRKTRASLGTAGPDPRIRGLRIRPQSGYSSGTHLCGLLAEPEWLPSRQRKTGPESRSFSFLRCLWADLGRERSRPVPRALRAPEPSVEGRPRNGRTHRRIGRALPMSWAAGGSCLREPRVLQGRTRPFLRRGTSRGTSPACRVGPSWYPLGIHRRELPANGVHALPPAWRGDFRPRPGVSWSCHPWSGNGPGRTRTSVCRVMSPLL